MLDPVVQKVLTDRGADIDALLNERPDPGSRLCWTGRLTLATPTPPAGLESASRQPARSAARSARARTPLHRSLARGGGLSTLLFLLPVLFVFGLFAWCPIGERWSMSFQQTNLVTRAGVRRAGQLPARCSSDPLLRPPSATPACSPCWRCCSATRSRCVAGRADERGAEARGLYSALAYLPVVIPPVVAVLLWKLFYDAGPDGVFNTILGWVGLGPLPWLQSRATAMASLVIEATWAAAGST